MVYCSVQCIDRKVYYHVKLVTAARARGKAGLRFSCLLAELAQQNLSSSIGQFLGLVTET